MTIWQSIGNAFKTGWNNGNLAKGLQITGLAAFGVGMTGAMIHDMKHSHHHCGSVFDGCFGGGRGGWGGCCGFGGYSNMGGIDPYLMQNPMAILNTPFAQQYGYGQMGAYSGMNFGMLGTAGMYSNLSQSNMYQQMYESPQNRITKTNNEYAGDVDTNTDTNAVEELNTAVNDLTANGSAVSGKSAQIADLSGVPKSEQEAKYKEQVSDLAKSFIAKMDKAGNKDGKVRVNEYVKMQLEDLPSSATAQQKADAERAAINAFALLDQNGDGYFDWKEAAAMMRTFDRDENNDVDGKIQSEDFMRHSTALASGATDSGAKLRQMFEADYKKLFGDE